MFRIFNHMVPLPRPSAIVCHPVGTYFGLDAIEIYGVDNQQLADRSGHLTKEHEEDNRDLEAEYDMKMRQVLDQYNGNIRSLHMDINYNGNTLKARKFQKKFVRRMKDLQNEKVRNKIWLGLWYDKRATRYMNFLRKEWIECDYCRGYPFWGDEVPPMAKP
ncbi:hypothetical protein ColTof4_08461 [Colletotrichum tofieldiae]|uniref:Uncharacterized protein n=1 Tax=Colletotrichum tofieldiae TaxID=708197 RepID=A0A166WBE5_9PEZI|nr:hypothetical protein CT0861_05912 [Colletotrichum tofieldiae]GKT54678.1 hypothetical protein ColTof3_02017 [Colletotrichum tofieldiae]GKT76038.1 hypothetical protein ColTof4_08461 [Colletotrichum tofieldiae]GKT83760.1 hypothetical protein Ct61P_01610 [Colletotrichum tofieldiae]